MRRFPLLPEKGIPRTNYPTSCEREWFWGDTAERYQKRGGHPLYGEHDVRYAFNSLGYRCPEFDAQADIRIVTLGCSYVFGTGLPAEMLFHARFAAKLRAQTSRSVVVWNLGMVGASNDYVTRVLFLVVRVLDPHVVLLHFTHLGRREYVAADCTPVNYTPRSSSDDPVTEGILDHMRALSSKYDDLLNFFRNYKAAEALLARRCWLFSLTHPLRLRPIFEHLDRRRYCGELPELDAARDGDHPGARSHEALCRAYWERFLAVGGCQQFAQLG